MTINKKLIINVFIFVFFISYLFFNIFLLSHYGTSWDEQAHEIRGQVYLGYFLTGNGDKKEVLPRTSINQNYYFGKTPADFSYYIKNDSGHPPINGILAALFNRLFYQNLGLLGDIEGYHLFVVLVSVFLVFLVFFWAYQEYGIFAGIIAFLSITLYPLFFGESHFNIKDPVEASFYTATLYTFYKGMTKNSWKWVIVSSIFAGFALGTKFNIFFTAFTILPWFIFYKWKEIKSLVYPLSKKLTIALIFFPFIALGILYAGWPFLWASPIDNFLKIIRYYQEIGYGINYQWGNYLIFGKINTFALQWIFYTTPLVILFFSMIGIIYTLRNGFKEKNKTALLVLLWFTIPIIRVTMPNAGIYGGVRQIMEFIPAMAILSGIGASYFAKQVSGIMYQVLRVKAVYKKNFILYTLYLILIFSFLPITLKLISIHPNENVYFNPIIGGLKGAKEKNFPYWGFSFGNVYRQGIEWINKNAGENSKAVSGAALEDILPRIWFRKDIKYSNAFRSGMQKKGEYVLELTHDMPVWPHYYYYNYTINMLKPLYEIKVDNVPILTVWKNDWDQTKDAFRKKEEVVDINNIKKDKNYILLDLGEEMFLTEVNIVFSNPNCRFTKDGYFVTADGRGKWINHPGDLSEMAFYENFDPRKNKDALSYLFPGEKTRLIKVIYSDDNNCFEDIKKVSVKKMPV